MVRIVCRCCLVALLFFILNGCANPINRVTYQRYYQAGVAAEQNGQYGLAKINYYRALVNAQMGNLEPQRVMRPPHTHMEECLAFYAIIRMRSLC